MVLNTYILHLFSEKPFEFFTLFMVYYTIYLITITTHIPDSNERRRFKKKNKVHKDHGSLVL